MTEYDRLLLHAPPGWRQYMLERAHFDLCFRNPVGLRSTLSLAMLGNSVGKVCQYQTVASRIAHMCTSYVDSHPKGAVWLDRSGNGDIAYRNHESDRNDTQLSE